MDNPKAHTNSGRGQNQNSSPRWPQNPSENLGENSTNSNVQGRRQDSDKSQVGRQGSGRLGGQIGRQGSDRLGEHIGGQISEQRDGIIVIAGGGTGGHIYPGVAIAKAIQLKSNFEVHFVGATGGLEEKIIPRENFPLHLISIGKLHSSVGIKVRLMTLLKIPLAFVQAVRLVMKLKPKAVLGVGGYASGPMLAVSRLFGIPTKIWEPNAHPGLANRILSRWVGECLVVFAEARNLLAAKNITRVGLPVRDTMRVVARPLLQGRRFRVLVFGGSQGSVVLNNAIFDMVDLNPSLLDKIEFVHQAGRTDFSRAQARVAQIFVLKAEAKYTCLAYFHDMDAQYQWADLVICRSGASTVAEICACQKAALFIPLPSAADDHQRKNAEVLVQSGAAEMILQKDLTPARLYEVLISIVNQPDRLAQLERKSGQFHSPGAAEKIAERLFVSARGEAHDDSDQSKSRSTVSSSANTEEQP
jgi:UDP-N-acetylglucosamine--N-acetylmuramyl-(pentapeptide) pyrophosphoryl-undecaprenol N-acetylglucosamine transferase